MSALVTAFCGMDDLRDGELPAGAPLGPGRWAFHTLADAVVPSHRQHDRFRPAVGCGTLCAAGRAFLDLYRRHCRERLGA
jgi:hypothetical protein